MEDKTTYLFGMKIVSSCCVYSFTQLSSYLFSHY